MVVGPSPHATSVEPLEDASLVLVHKPSPVTGSREWALDRLGPG